MARPRIELHEVLKTLADNVYFQAPPPAGMKYPCILYKRDDADVKHADNVKYAHRYCYMVTVIDRDPDYAENLPIKDLPYTEFVRAYQADGLNHDVYNLFF